jgi:hypothetical protein
MQREPVNSLAAAMTEVVATLHAPINVSEALSAITAAAVDTLAGVDYVSIR